MRLPPQDDEKASEYYGRLKRLEEHVCANIQRAVPLEEAAAVAGMTPNSFSAWMPDHANATYTDWLGERRLRHAEGIFRTRNCNVLDAGLESGFECVRSFQRVCRRLRGCTPAELRAQCRRDAGI